MNVVFGVFISMVFFVGGILSLFIFIKLLRDYKKALNGCIESVGTVAKFITGYGDYTRIYYPVIEYDRNGVIDRLKTDLGYAEKKLPYKLGDRVDILVNLKENKVFIKETAELPIKIYTYIILVAPAVMFLAGFVALFQVAVRM